MLGLGSLFASVPDPRAPNARHALPDLLLIAFAAVLCGAESCVDMADFAASKRDVLAQVLGLGHGVPSHDTFSRVSRLLDPSAFEAAFCAFMGRFAAAVSGQVGPAGQVVALDGTSLRGAVDAARRSTPLHLVTAWAAEQRLVLAVRRAPGRSEVAAAREIIGLLDLTATTVTADALHGSQATAKAICSRGGDDALVIKGNRGPLHADMQALLADTSAAPSALTTDDAHGRHEERRATVLPVPGDWAKRHTFTGLAAAARIDCLRRIGGKEERHTRYVALARLLDPAEALRVVRVHRSIENNQHWLPDVAFGEDRIATRHDNTAENLAVLRRLALNLMRTDAHKASIRRKIKRAGWDNPDLLTLLRQMR